MKRVALALLSTAVAVPAMAQSSSLTVGTPLQGELSASSPVDAHRGCASNTYELSATEGDGYEVRLVSDEFDTYLIVEAPSGAVVEMNDDFEGSHNSGVRFRAPETGTYSIMASSFGCQDVGLFQLTASVVDPSMMPDPNRAITSAPIAYGVDVNGELNVQDAYFNQRDTYVDVYTFEGTAGDGIAATLNSGAFDAYLLLVGPSGLPITEDDDGGENTNSLLTHTLTETGTYRLLATSYSTRAEGPYTLSVTDDYVAPIALARPLSPGQTLSGALGGTHQFRVELEAGTPIVIDVESTDFDTVVQIMDPVGNYPLFSDDDGGDGTNSRIVFSPYTTGEAMVEVLSYAGVQSGAFDITFDNARGEDVSASRLRMNRPVSGVIDAGDPRSNVVMQSMDVYSLELDANSVVTVQLDGLSDEMYSPVSLRVVDPLGEVVSDFNGYSNTSLVVSAFNGGTYHVFVQAMELGSAYTLSATEGRVAVELAEPIGGVEIGSETTGTLTSDSGTYAPRNAPADIYTFVVEESSPITISMNASFDTYLAVLDASGRSIVENDDFDGLNSSVTHTFAPGEYQVVATMFSGGEGDYTLRVGGGEFTNTVIHPVTIGQAQQINISRSTGVDEYNAPTAYLAFDGTAGQELTIRASMPDMDSYLQLLDELGQVVATNDDADGALDSRITLTLPRDGRYTIAVRDLSNREGMVTIDVREGLEGDPIAPYYNTMGYGMGAGDMGYGSGMLHHGEHYADEIYEAH